MTKRLLGIVLACLLAFYVFPTGALAYTSPHAINISERRPVDILIVQDPGYPGGTLPEFAARLESALAAEGLGPAEYRLSTVELETDVSLSDFDGWYVYDHYYHPIYPPDGSAPEGWDDRSGRRPYFYWKETSFKIPPSALAAGEEDLHEQLWAEYALLIYSCNQAAILRRYAAQIHPYGELSRDEQAAVYEAVLEAVRDYTALITYGRCYGALTDEEKNLLVYQIEWELFGNFDYHYGSVLLSHLEENAVKALADEFLLINCIKPFYTDEEYEKLSDEEKAAALSEYRDLWFSTFFSEYLAGETASNLDDQRRAEIISGYYYDAFIYSFDIYNKISAHLISNKPEALFVTDITSPGSMDAVYLRDRHIYAGAAGGDTSVVFLGYSEPAYKDFLICPASSAAKTVSFDMDASEICAHALDGAGLLMNSGIDEDGFIHGYILFYKFNSATAGTVYLLKIKDGVLAEDMHNYDGYGSLVDSGFVYATPLGAFGFNGEKKRVDITITPASLSCVETDYTDAGGTSPGTARTLYDGALDDTGYNGFGPLASFLRNDYEKTKISKFTFSNLRMGYRRTAADGLRGASFIESAQKVYIVLSGGDGRSGEPSYFELLARLKQDQIFYLTTGPGGGDVVSDSGGNGLWLSGSSPEENAQAAARYIAGLYHGDISWGGRAALPTSEGLPPVAIFDITDGEGTFVNKVDIRHLNGGAYTVRFGNTGKSVALAEEAGELTYHYAVYDPEGKPVDLAGGDALVLDGASLPGVYTFVLTVSEGGRTSEPAARTLTVVRDTAPPEVAVLGRDEAPHTAGSITLRLFDGESGVAAYAIGRASGGGEPVYGEEVVFPEAAQKDVTLTLESGEYTLYVKVYDACGNERVWSRRVSVAPTPDDGRPPDEPPDTPPSDVPGDTPPAAPISPGSVPVQVPVIVGGKTVLAGVQTKGRTSDGRATLTVTLSPELVGALLDSAEDQAVIAVPIEGAQAVKTAALTGRLIKDMEDREAALEIRTGEAVYTLPTGAVSISAIAEQFGEDADLADITVEVTIAAPSGAAAQLVQDAAAARGFKLVVPAIEFTVRCTYNGRTIDVTAFGSYVEWMVAIPDGVDHGEVTTAVVVEPSGAVRHVPTRVALIDGRYYAVISSLTNSTYSVISNPAAFEDVSGHWAQGAVNDMGARLVVTGDENGRFNPDSFITRAEFATALVRALGIRPADTCRFKDAAPEAWHGGYIEAAARHGLIFGYDEATFGPDDPITREQAMAVVARAMAVTRLDAALSAGEAESLLGAFADGAAVSAFAREGAAACLKTGVAHGRGGGTLAPKELVTRAEAAVMLRRLLQKSGLI